MLDANTIVYLFDARVVDGKANTGPWVKLIWAIYFFSEAWTEENIETTVEFSTLIYAVFVFLELFFFFEEVFFNVPDKNEVQPVIWDFLFSFPIEFM
jgi:hypothetical protein